jgi:hypothetical protein
MHIVPIECNIVSFFIFTCVGCALRIGFLDDGDRLYGSTLSYTILDTVVFFTTRCAMLS